MPHWTSHDYTAVQSAGKQRVEVRAIRSVRHVLHTIVHNRVALSALDSKRDGVHTLACGHWRCSGNSGST